MRPLALPTEPGAPLRILAVGAHSDDIELGCGGTLLTWIARHPAVHVRWVVFSGTGERREEARASAAEFLAGAAESRVQVHAFRESFFASQAAEIKEAFEALKESAPDVVLTHHRGDAHQDHRLLGELAWNTFRDHVVLEYEIPKYDGDLGRPNAFVPLTAEVCRRKCDLIQKHFASQRERHWFDDEVFLGLLRLRGMECRSPSGYAEAFHAAKIVIG